LNWSGSLSTARRQLHLQKMLGTLTCECSAEFTIDENGLFFDTFIYKHCTLAHGQRVSIRCGCQNMKFKSKKQFQCHLKHNVCKYDFVFEGRDKSVFGVYKRRNVSSDSSDGFYKSDGFSSSNDDISSGDTDDDIVDENDIVLEEVRALSAWLDSLPIKYNTNKVVYDSGKKLLSHLVDGLRLRGIKVDSEIAKHQTYSDAAKSFLSKVGITPEVPLLIPCTVTDEKQDRHDVHVVNVAEMLKSMAQNDDYFNEWMKRFLAWMHDGFEKGSFYSGIHCNMCGDLYKNHPLIKEKKNLAPLIFFHDGIRMSKNLETSGKAQNCQAGYLTFDFENLSNCIGRDVKKSNAVFSDYQTFLLKGKQRAAAEQTVGRLKWELPNLFCCFTINKWMFSQAHVPNAVFSCVADQFKDLEITLKDNTKVYPRICVLVGDHPAQCEILNVKQHMATRACLRCSFKFACGTTKIVQGEKAKEFGQMKKAFEDKKVTREMFDEQLNELDELLLEVQNKKKGAKKRLHDFQQHTGILGRCALTSNTGFHPLLSSVLDLMHNEDEGVSKETCSNMIK
jgi:hypothetical protein